LIEVFVIGALIYVGWEKPFRDWLPANISGVAKATPTPAVQLQPFARSTSTPSGAWVTDPNRHSPLDTPGAPANYPQRSPTGGGSWMWDPKHHSALDPPSHKSTPRP
jgi:hypothetical protein